MNRDKKRVRGMSRDEWVMCRSKEVYYQRGLAVDGGSRAHGDLRNYVTYECPYCGEWHNGRV